MGWLVLCISIPPANATAPGASGRLAISAFTTKGGSAIYSIKADGSGLTRLTSTMDILYEGFADPAWSPDGSKIAFSNNAGKLRTIYTNIYSMNADGSGVTKLTKGDAEDTLPAWSPDGSHIAFVTDRNHYAASGTDIYTMSADGKNLKQLTVAGTNGTWSWPDWSPDGTKIAFEGTPDYGVKRDIYTMSPDGTDPTNPKNLTNLTNSPYTVTNGTPSWSPDGSTIAFTSNRDGNFEIYTMNANGSGVTRLTNDVAPEGDPSWSPDGTKIAFASNLTTLAGTYIMNADGTNVTLVEGFAGRFERASWQPLPPVPYRADALIRKKAAAASMGEYIFNTTARVQNVGLRAKRGATSWFVVGVRNDGTQADSFQLHGCQSSKGFLVHYFLGSINITRSVKQGTYLTGQLAPGSSWSIYLSITAKVTAKLKSSKRCTVLASSQGEASIADAVQARVKVS